MVKTPIGDIPLTELKQHDIIHTVDGRNTRVESIIYHVLSIDEYSLIYEIPINFFKEECPSSVVWVLKGTLIYDSLRNELSLVETIPGLHTVTKHDILFQPHIPFIQLKTSNPLLDFIVMDNIVTETHILDRRLKKLSSLIKNINYFQKQSTYKKLHFF